MRRTKTIGTVTLLLLPLSFLVLAYALIAAQWDAYAWNEKFYDVFTQELAAAGDDFVNPSIGKVMLHASYAEAEKDIKLKPVVARLRTLPLDGQPQIALKVLFRFSDIQPHPTTTVPILFEERS